jgi:hypothetical protein
VWTTVEADVRTASHNSLVWSNARESIDAYLGSGLGKSWTSESVFQWNCKDVRFRRGTRPLQHCPGCSTFLRNER